MKLFRKITVSFDKEVEINKARLKSMLVSCHPTGSTETMRMETFFDDDPSRKIFFGLSFFRFIIYNCFYFLSGSALGS